MIKTYHLPDCTKAIHNVHKIIHYYSKQCQKISHKPTLTVRVNVDVLSSSGHLKGDKGLSFTLTILLWVSHDDVIVGVG